MKKKKTSKTEEKNSAVAVLEQFKLGLEKREGVDSESNPEYKQVRGDLIAQALSTLHTSRHLENCKQQINENLRYIGDFSIKNGMPKGKSVALIDEGSGVYYQGPVNEGVPDTKAGEKGISIEQDGSIYLGEWKNGEAVGQGILIDSFENIFMGEFIQGQLEGNGKELLNNGLILEGTFTVVNEEGKDLSQLNGEGKLTIPDGYSFEGKWVNGRRNGSGIEKFPEGYVCVGEWEEDCFHAGIIRYLDGTIEEGNFDQDYELSGEGSRTFANGTKIYNLSGQWRDGFLEGEGQVIFPEDFEIREFQGEFKKTSPHGYGVLKFNNGTIQEGKLKNGAFIGNVKITVPGKYQYEGRLKASEHAHEQNDFIQGELEPHGSGKIVFDNGSYYEGDWEHGVPEGQGELFVPDKFHYKGDFEEGKFHGKGSLKSLETKYSFDGNFIEGQKHGKGKEVLSNNVVLEGTFEADMAISIKTINFANLFDSSHEDED